MIAFSVNPGGARWAPKTMMMVVYMPDACVANITRDDLALGLAHFEQESRMSERIFKSMATQG